MKKLPKLPYGEGSFSYRGEGIEYRKRIKLDDGTYKTKTVYGETTQECMEKMRDTELQLKKSSVNNKNTELLYKSMYNWLENVKKSELKPQSYKRLESTIRNQIETSRLGSLRFADVNSDDIQKLINQLNKENYSHSVIKKTYDLLNAFYRYASIRFKIDNPMLLVTMPKMSNVKRETRTIIWFEQEDIDKFIEEAGATWKTGTPRYQGGYVYAANIYLGLRIGELLALQWQDIDLDKNTIYVHKTLIEEANPDYDANDPNSRKVRYSIQSSNKTNQNRYVPINSKAKALLLKHLDRCVYKEPTDYIISTRNRKTTTIKNADDTIKAIQRNAGTTVQGASSHAIRHTCASLYFRAGVPIEYIAQILGHSVEVCRTIYVHFCEEQLKDAASKITVFEI